MSATPREIGTLIVVVLKANHLPNKRHIGKQDPYCVVEVNGEKRRTKAIKRGGQHPEWDEEIRFTLYEDLNDILDRTASGGKTPPPPPPKDGKESRKIKGGKTMKLACYADDTREPDLIGDANVDLTEVLTKGETDEWFNLSYKDKFAGKVYLELTFWSNAPAPEKKSTPKPAKNKQYAGPGSFVPSGEPSTTGYPPPSRVVSASSQLEHSRQSSDTVPASLRPSSSLAKLDLYVPPYEQKNNLLSVDKITNEFKDFGVSDHRRRESFPPPRGGHTPRPISPSGFSTFRSHPSSDSASIYSYDQPGQSHIHGIPQYHGQPSYQSPNEHPPSTFHQPPAHRGPRHSIPISSSGFVPLPVSSDITGYGASTLGYNPHQAAAQPVYVPQTAAPVSSNSFIPQQAFSHSQSFHYPTTNPIPQSYTPMPPAAQAYQPYGSTPPTSHDGSISIAPSASLPSSLNVGSRPLPQQPQVIYTQQNPLSYPIPPPSGIQQPIGFNAQAGASVFSTAGVYQPPPPPPPPPLQYPGDQQPQHGYVPNGLPPPPPPPQIFPVTSSQRQSGLSPVPGEQHSASGPPTPPPPRSRRQSSLPQPPVMYQQSAYQTPLPLPPPPPPPDFINQTTLPPPPPPPPPAQKPVYHPGPPPHPPVQVNGHGQWMPMQPGTIEYI